MKQEAGNTVPITPIGVIRSPLRTRPEAPKQSSEGAPDAWLEMAPAVARGLQGIAAGKEIIVITWFHRARRDVLQVHPRGTNGCRSPACSQRALRTDRTRWGCIASEC